MSWSSFKLGASRGPIKVIFFKEDDFSFAYQFEK